MVEYSPRPDDAARRLVLSNRVGVAAHEEILRRLSIRDDAYVQSILSQDWDQTEDSGLDGKTHALVRLGALIAIDAATPSYMSSIESARNHGATADEIVGCLLAVMPAVGSSRVVSAAPKLSLALGYDVEEALSWFPG
jgi:alkylhydroperoxidase/carboxymuconolactone decarboxylase family protein YurZ